MLVKYATFQSVINENADFPLLKKINSGIIIFTSSEKENLLY
jgi:hypothetical protein